MRMRRRTFVRVVAGSALGLVAGCKQETPPPAKEEGAVTDKPPYPDTTLCGKCGQVKGSAMCCCNKPDQPRCPKCGLFLGSPGCCRITKGETATLCGKCGQVKGSELCCCNKPDQPRCTMCGLFKGSPGCCRINKPEVQTAAIAMAKVA